ncbi:FAD-dependent monooxygenase [Mucilaginibacter lappiensis]|uniref:2-polyprenyl-6-methoxyphenol hydroxylase-like FAD-dependent oxidoreductase n=1 Tax=Mucilaginibacter lappiensis TaxID=354630 RepID=A0A841J4Q8_9SPHI|nr:FAD-dependent monooxygenase [Mucilaginibacter lappiensis]MBB6126189.1 2-polyprenyl-6-methoxyphenol hydroxylase-like FAD-dependent oxidoreductase [Mucilaginibacter lappiensis]
MMNNDLNNRNILISGASIASPALAYWLNQYGFNVTVVEKAPELRKGGYRIDLRGVATDVAQRMGILNQVKELNTAMRGSSMINADGKRYADLNDPNIFGMRQDGDVEIMRGELSGILYAETKDQTEYIFDNSVTTLTQTNECVTVTFKNGEQREFDLVVAADGLRSNVRGLAFDQEKISVNHLGYFVSVFTIPNYFNLDHWELNYPAVDKIVNIYSTGKNREAKVLLMFAAITIEYDHRDVAQQKQIVIDHFKDEGPAISKILDAIHDTTDFYFDAISQVKAENLSNGRVVLLGDAGYCPSPASGQGSSLAFVGAYILAGELAASYGNHQAAFANYESQMRWFVKANQQLGVTVLKDMVPKSKKQLWLQTTMLRLMLKLPGKEKILKNFLKEMQRSVDEAANAIELKNYDHHKLQTINSDQV